MSRYRNGLLRVFGSLLLLSVVEGCAPDPQYPYEQEPDPRKQGQKVTELDRAYEVTVFGNVENPGTFQPDRFLTVMEVLDLAGGLAPRANGNRIVIERRGQKIPFVYDRVVGGDRPEMNIVVLPGDIIQVP